MAVSWGPVPETGNQQKFAQFNCYAHILGDDLLLYHLQVVREASRRVLGLRPFDVQLIGGMILHEGNIAEMRTGEGKTLVAVLPSYLNALAGKVASIAF